MTSFVVNSCHSTYATAVDSGSSRNKDDTLSEKVFFTPLSARNSHFIRQDLLVLHVCVAVTSPVQNFGGC